MPACSVEHEQFEAFSALPLCQNDGPCPMVSGHPLQAGEVVSCRTRGGTTFRLNENDLKQIATLETWTVLMMILPDRDQVHNATGFRFRRATKVDQVPLGSLAPAVRDEPLRHRPRPLGGMVCFPPGAHLLKRACHVLCAANNELTRLAG